MSEIQTVRFDGDNLQTVQDDGQAWVVLKRACEALGLTEQGQATKLKNKPWAVTTMIVATGPDGRNYSMFCLDLDSFAGWLFSIDANRVRPEAREKLVHYQRECARVLRDHFFGREPSRLDTQAMADLITRAMEPVVHALNTVAHGMQGLAQRVEALEQRANNAEIVTAAKHRQIRATVTSIAMARHSVGDAPSVKSARTSIDQRLRKLFGWGGVGQPWRLMPASMVPHVESFLAELRRDADARLAKAQPSQSRQMALAELLKSGEKPN